MSSRNTHIIRVIKHSIRWLLGKLGYKLVSRHAFPNGLDHQKKLLEGNKSPIIFDVGANEGAVIGWYRERFESPIIHAFEPLPGLYESLRERFMEDDSVKVHPYAIASEPGTATFYANPAHVQSSLLPISETGAKSYLPHGSEVEVEVTTLDRYCREHSVDRIDLLKLDIQGGEMMALRGSDVMLCQNAIDAIYLECWFVEFYQGATSFYEIDAYLRSKNYRLFGIYDLTRDSNDQLIKVDALYVSPDRQAKLDAAEPYWHSPGRKRAEAEQRNKY